ncbi:MAG: gluconate 2-dehydrogenase subunit 3 family protein [Cyclobacteriaceae bacterium]|nr:gluconate 2-dehydrogenase subunit 3 family protein [Cyclobacteriaceae bacterium]
MKLDRRTVLKQMAVIAAGAALVPGCMNSRPSSAGLFGSLQISVEQEQAFRALAEAIIPGAMETGATSFMARIVKDCMMPSDQAAFLKGLDSMMQYAVDKGIDFNTPDPTKLQSVLADLENEKDQLPELYNFYAGGRQLAIRAYTSTEYYLTQVNPYKMIPGKFKGCVKLTA